MSKRRCLLAVVAATVLLSGCQMTRQNPYTGEEELADMTVGGTVGCMAGAVAGAMAGTEAAVLGCAGGAMVGGYLTNDLDKQADELRSELIGTGVQVVELDNSIQLNMDNLINFESSDFALSHEIKPALRSVATVLKAYPNSTIEVKGFADSSGNLISNITLSKDRAKSVADFIKSHGVAENRVRVMAYGIQEPLCENGTPQGRACNRRVELEIK